jgi:hypothetical protein
MSIIDMLKRHLVERECEILELREEKKDLQINVCRLKEQNDAINIENSRLLQILGSKEKSKMENGK